MAGIELSTIIPTFNRRARLERVLQALAAQSVPSDGFEVIVVDDGSTDGTTEACAAQNTPFALRVLRQENAGPATARNRGVQAAQGAIVLFLDDDVVPATDLIREHLTTHAKERGIAVIGPLASLPSYRQPWVAWEQRKIERQYDAMLRGDWEPTYRQFWTGNASVARELVLQVGGFDPRFQRAEDVEFAARLRERGVRFRFNPAALGVHHAERSLASWGLMHRAYGRLEMSIHGAAGQNAALDRMADNWRGLRPATRGLVKSLLGRPLAAASTSALLRAVILSGAVLPLGRLTQAACSALANVFYWSGVEETLGAEALRGVLARAKR